MFGFIALPEGNTVHRHHTIRQVEMQVLTVTHGTGVAVVNQISAQEERTLIARSERLQTLQDLDRKSTRLNSSH